MRIQFGKAFISSKSSLSFLKSFLVAEVNIVGLADSFNHCGCGYLAATITEPALLQTSTVDDHYEEADKLCQDKKGG